jgi:dihydrodipicolinate synthase/N-acetylneuraminate lyase
LQLWSQRKDFSYLLGWAARSAVALQNGADGIVPSTANIDPGLYFHLYAFVQKGDMEHANQMQELSDGLGNVYQAGRTLGESIAALKVLLAHQKICQPYVMQPLQKLAANIEDEIINAYKTFLH